MCIIWLQKAPFLFCRFLGLLTCFITKPIPGIVYPSEAETPLESFVKLILFHLSYKSALQRLAVSLVLSEWAKSENGVSFMILSPTTILKIFIFCKLIYCKKKFIRFISKYNKLVCSLCVQGLVQVFIFLGYHFVRKIKKLLLGNLSLFCEK